VQNNRVWERACGLVRTVVEGVRFDEAGDAVIVSVRSDAGHTRDFDAMAAWLAVRTSTSTTTARLDRQNRPETVAGIPPQRRPPLRVRCQRSRRQRSPRQMVDMGPPITTPKPKMTHGYDRSARYVRSKARDSFTVSVTTAIAVPTMPRPMTRRATRSQVRSKSEMTIGKSYAEKSKG